MKNLNRFNRDEAVWYAHKVICAYYDVANKAAILWSVLAVVAIVIAIAFMDE